VLVFCTKKNLAALQYIGENSPYPINLNRTEVFIHYDRSVAAASFRVTLF
jgi:hypothetical protein